MALIKFVEVDGVEVEPTWHSVRHALDQLGRCRVHSLVMDAERGLGNRVFIVNAVDPSGFIVTARGRSDTSNFDMIDAAASDEMLECRLPNGEPELTTVGGLLRIEQVVAAAEHFFTSLERLPSATWREPFALEDRIVKGEPVRRLRVE